MRIKPNLALGYLSITIILSDGYLIFCILAYLFFRNVTYVNFIVMFISDIFYVYDAFERIFYLAMWRIIRLT